MFSKVSATAAFGLLILFISVGTVSASLTDVGLWHQIDDTALAARPLKRTRTPDRYSTFEMDKKAMYRLLASAPEEYTRAAEDVIIDLPMPDGKFARFRFEHSLVAEQGLVDKFPELGRTYRGYGIDDPTASVRIDFLPSGFHAMILSTGGTVMVDPYAIGDTDNYVSYYKGDLPKLDDFKCEVGEKTIDSLLNDSLLHADNLIPDTAPNVISGTSLRTYRLALAADNEYCVAVGGNTVAGSLAAQVLIMNRVNGVYERDLAIHMNIVANNNLIVYAGDNLTCGGVACTSANDPYTNSSGSSMLGQNQTAVNAAIGSANYDIGHVFSTGGGGVASLGVPCGGSKAQGVTGQSNPIGDPFAIDYVAHEMGHQWGANHTFNGSVGNCSGNRAGSAAYETGSGITIMAYAGICGTQDLDPHSIDTFHVKSLEEIVAYSQTGNGNTCAVATSSGNTPPSVSVVGGPTFNIPKQTPFALTASGSDINGDTVTYDWQEYDLGSATTAVPNTDSGGAMPILRPYLPTVSPIRVFPALTYILNNANVPPASSGTCPSGPCLTGELLPQIARTMTFKVIARDNRANAGGINTATATVVVNAASGPFAVTSPNTAVTWAGNSTQTVNWNVAGTTAAPVSAANVKISFSSDGGNTFPTVLLASTPNDGTETVTIPNVATATARIKVESATGIFFDISDANFTVTAASAVKSRADFDGDGRTDVSVYRPSEGNWYLNRSTAGFSALHWGGVAGDILVPGDYDGDGKADFAIWRPSDAAGITDLYVLNSNGFTISGYSHGLTTDIPVAGDFDGDGKADVVVWRPSTGTWWIYGSATSTTTSAQFGTAGDIPMAIDNDGDGKANFAVYRPSTNTWYIAKNTGAPAQNFDAVQWGMAGDVLVPADYDGDGKEDVAVFRPSNGVWYIRQSSNGVLNAMQFGTNGDVPVPGDYDGDGKTDVAVYRSGVWYVNQSTSGFTAQSFGIPTDTPVPAKYHP